jgi:heat shock protein HslJ
MKITFTALLVLLLTLVLAGCSGDGPRDTEIPVTTEFGRMLGFVPNTFMEKHDIWYSDPGTLKERYGMENLNSVEDIRQLEGEKSKEFLDDLDALPVAQSYSQKYWLEPLTGWNWVNIDRAVFSETPAPWGFSVVEGDFDEELIGEKLTEQGYAKSEYGAKTYYHINDDMQINMGSELGRMVLAQLNRVAVLDDTLVVAPATGIMTGVLDAIKENKASVIAAPSCRAVTESLGAVQGAVLINSDRVLQLNPDSTPAFDLPAAANWGRLHDYTLFGTGYLDDGVERYWIISLYYGDKGSAAADAGELVSRLESYAFNTHLQLGKSIPLTSIYEVGEPVVKEYPEGATLTVKCRYLPDITRLYSLFTLVVPGRDLLFLAPDPSAYIAKTPSADSGAPSGYTYIDYTGSSAASQGKFGLTKAVWGPYSIYLLGDTNLADGTWVRAKLYKDGTAVNWWPDNYGLHIQDGKWEFHVKARESGSPEIMPGLEELPEFEHGYSLRIWSMDSPDVTAELSLDSPGPPAETRIPDSDRAVNTELEGSKWQLVSLNGSAPLTGTTITLEFNKDEAAGRSGCNYYGGRYLTRNPNIIHIYGMTTTLLGCDQPILEQEQAYTQYLNKAVCYRIENDKLELYDVITNNRTLAFERQP